MKLEEFLAPDGQNVRKFARAAGLAASSVYNYLLGYRRPNADALVGIARASRGEVLPNDFFPEAMRVASRFRRKHRASNGAIQKGRKK